MAGKILNRVGTRNHKLAKLSLNIFVFLLIVATVSVLAAPLAGAASTHTFLNSFVPSGVTLPIGSALEFCPLVARENELLVGPSADYPYNYPVVNVSTQALMASLASPSNRGRGAAWSDEGSMIAIAGGGGGSAVNIYRTDTWALLYTIPYPGYYDAYVDFKGGSWLAVCWTYQGHLRIYRTSDWALIKEFTFGSGTPTFSPNGNFLVERTGNGQSGGYYGYSIINSSDNNPVNWTITTTITPNSSYIPGTAIFSPDSSELAIPVGDNKIYVYSTSTWAVLKTLNLGTETPSGVAWSPSGQDLAVAVNSTAKLRVFDTSTWAQSYVYDTGSSTTANLVDYNADGTRLVMSVGIYVYVFSVIPTGSIPPNSPTSLLCEGQTNPTHVINFTPKFSAIGTDNDGSQMNYYALQVDDDSGFGSPIWDKTKTSITTFNSGSRCSDITYAGSSLARGTTYYWRIKFWDVTGNEGAWSTETATFRINQLPSTSALKTEGQTNPTRLTTVTPTFSWTYSDGDADTQSKYEVWVGTTSGGSDKWNSGQVASSSTSAVYAGSALSRGVTYYVQTRTFDGYEWSSWVTGTFRINQLPTAPTGWTDLGMNLTNHTPAISWTKGTDADGDTVTTYVYVGTTSTPTTVETSTTGTTANLGTTVPLNDGVTYYYRLRSWDGYEWSGYTTEDQFRMNSVPTTPTTLTLNSQKVGEILTANASGSTDAEGDSITYYYRFYNNNDGVTRQDWSTTSTYTIQAVDAHDNIRVYAKAYDGYEYSGERENSKIIANTVPTTPTTLLLNSPQVGQSLTSTASGSTDTDGDSIAYYYKFYNQTDGVERQSYSTTSTYTIVIADAHDNIKVYTKAYDGYEYSGERENSVIVSNSLPTVPTGFTDLGMNLTNHTPTVTWTKGTDADGDTVTAYVYVGTISTPTTEETHNTGTTANLGSTVLLSDGVTYYYRLSSYDGYGYSSYTTADQFRMNSLPIAENQKVEGQVNPVRLTTFTPTLSWNYADLDGDAQTQRQIQVGTAENTSNMWDNTVSTSSTSAVYAGSALNRGVTYYWRVRVYDGYEWSGWKYGGTFRLNQLPTTPTSLLLNAPQVGQNLTATASGSTDADGDTITYYYRFYNQTDGVERRAYSTSNTYTITVADAHDNIKVFTKAYDGYEYSAEKENSVIVANTLPTATSLKTEGQTNPTRLTTFTPTFSWTYSDADADTQSHYEIWVGTTSGASDMWNSGQVAGSATSRAYAGSALSRGITYYVQVRTKDGYEWSGWATGTFRINQAPFAENQKAEGQVNPTHLTTFTPTLSWSYVDPDSDAQTQRQIQVGTSENGNSMWDSTVSTSSTSVVYAGSALSRGVTYYWRVHVYDGYEWSPWCFGGTFRLNQIPVPSTLTTGTTAQENIYQLIMVSIWNAFYLFEVSP